MTALLETERPIETPEQLLRRLGTSARTLFAVYVLGREHAERDRLSERVELIAGPGDQADAAQAGDVLVRGAMGEGHVLVSVLVTGELVERGEGLEPEGRQPGRYAWVVEDDRPREDRFARRITDRRGFVPAEQALLRPTGAAAPPREEFGEAVNRRSPEYVRWYQGALNRIDNAGLAVDGIAGPLTRAAVRRYQARKGLQADGVVGPITEGALILDGAGAPPGFEGPAPGPAPPAPPVPVATNVRERRNVTSLSAAERNALIAAIQAFRATPRYAGYVRDHFMSMNTAHGTAAFLPWHRQFVLYFESELRRMPGGAGVTVPYWDWSNDPGTVGTGRSWNNAMLLTMGGGGSPITGPFANFRAITPDGRETALPLARDFGRVGRLPTALEIDAVLQITPYDVADFDDNSPAGFRNPLEQAHGQPHVWVGGQMFSPATSPNDPAFYLHHCFVDKLWADWQGRHRSSSYLPTTATGPSPGINDPTPVLNVGRTGEVRSRAADSLDLTNLKDQFGTTVQVRYV